MNKKSILAITAVFLLLGTTAYAKEIEQKSNVRASAPSTFVRAERGDTSTLVRHSKTKRVKTVCAASTTSLRSTRENENEGDEHQARRTSVCTTVPNGTTTPVTTPVTPPVTPPQPPVVSPVVPPVTPPAAPTFTLAQIATHNTAGNCYSAISGGVYNITSYISSHPGGSSIVAVCGKDGTALFTAQHGGQSTPVSVLAAYKIGTLI